MLQMVRIISTPVTPASFPSSPSCHAAPPNPQCCVDAPIEQQGCARWAELDRGLDDAMVMGDSNGDISRRMVMMIGLVMHMTGFTTVYQQPPAQAAGEQARLATGWREVAGSPCHPCKPTPTHRQARRIGPHSSYRCKKWEATDPSSLTARPALPSAHCLR